MLMYQKYIGATYHMKTEIQTISKTFLTGEDENTAMLEIYRAKSRTEIWGEIRQYIHMGFQQANLRPNLHIIQEKKIMKAKISHDSSLNFVTTQTQIFLIFFWYQDNELTIQYSQANTGMYPTCI